MSIYAGVFCLQGRGINVGEVSMDLEKLMGVKDKTVSELTGGIEYLFKKNGVDYFKGLGTITDTNTVTCTGADGKVDAIPTKNILIATGACPLLRPCRLG